MGSRVGAGAEMPGDKLRRRLGTEGSCVCGEGIRGNELEGVCHCGWDRIRGDDSASSNVNKRLCILASCLRMSVSFWN